MRKLLAVLVLAGVLCGCVSADKAEEITVSVVEDAAVSEETLVEDVFETERVDLVYVQHNTYNEYEVASENVETGLKWFRVYPDKVFTTDEVVSYMIIKGEYSELYISINSKLRGGSWETRKIVGKTSVSKRHYSEVIAGPGI